MGETRLGPAWPDWQDDGAYEYTARLTRCGWAWEFLRRNPDFQKDLAVALRHAECSQARSVVIIRLASTTVDLSRWGLLFCKFARE
ncbi:transcriptional regulator domain-containing protein [Mesorhizobium sp. BHbdii]